MYDHVAFAKVSVRVMTNVQVDWYVLQEVVEFPLMAAEIVVVWQQVLIVLILPGRVEMVMLVSGD